jgi:hypothetical protein
MSQPDPPVLHFVARALQHSKILRALPLNAATRRRCGARSHQRVPEDWARGQRRQLAQGDSVRGQRHQRVPEDWARGQRRQLAQGDSVRGQRRLSARGDSQRRHRQRGQEDSVLVYLS